MSKVFRAVWIAAVATGAAISLATLAGVKRGPLLPKQTRPAGPKEIDADQMDPEEAEALMRELGTHL